MAPTPTPPSPPPKSSSVTVADLTVRFEGSPAPAVERFSLEVAPGEVVALLGPSGCGKTTVLRAVAGLQAPTAGRILLDGRDVTALPTHRRGVGLMFQDYALFPHRDVGDNVAFGLRMQGLGRGERRRRVAEVLDMVGLAGWEDRPVGLLSGGERQRVALARALAPAPGVLLLDEPLGALDRSLRDRLLPEMSELFARLGTTVVHVTHDQGEALGMADRVVVMDAGRIRQVGSPAEVWSRPADAAVARFLGFTNLTEDLLVRPDAVRVEPASRAGDEVAAAGGPPGGEGASPGSFWAAIRSQVTARGGSGSDVGAPTGGVEWSGVVRRVVFEGALIELRVVLDDGTALDARLSTGGALAGGGALPRVADRVRVTVDPAGIVPFDDAPTSPPDGRAGGDAR